jgi:N-carbamoylputrescine amidase
MKNVRAAAVQFEHVASDKQANLRKVRAFVEQAARERVDLILFPECCITGYWFLRHLSREELGVLAEPVFEGPSSQELMALSTQNGMTVGAGLVEVAEDGALYNTYVVATPDGTARRHRKLHAFVSEYMSNGSEYTVFDTPQGYRAGILTCYDNNLVENVRITALQGAEIILAPHQTGGCRTHNPHLMGVIDRRLWDERAQNPEAIENEFRGPKGRGWLMRWLPARAHDNGIFLIFSNGVGVDDDEIRTGNSMIIDPNGRILVETSKAGDDMVIADLDGSLVAPSVGQAFLKARRPDLYRPLAEKTGREEDTRSLKFKE